MEEIYKSAQNVHRSIITVSAACLVFALSPNEGYKYERTIEELSRLQQLDVQNAFHSAMRSQIDKDYAHVSVALRKVLNDQDIEVQSKVPLLPSSVLQYDPLLPDLSTIEAFVKYCNSLRYGVIFDPNIDDFRQQFATGLKKEHLDEVASNRNVELINLGEDPILRDFSKVRITKLSTQIRTRDRNSAGGFLGDDSEVGYWVGLEDKKGNYLEHSIDQVKGNVVHIKNVDFTAWLKLQQPSLVARDGTNELVLPEARRVWNEVYTLSPKDAIPILEGRRAAAKQSVSLLGVSVSENIVLFAGPFALVVLMLYMCVYLIYLNSHKVDENENHSPWVSVLPGNLSALLTYATLCILPMLVVLALAFRFVTTMSYGMWAWIVICTLVLATSCFSTGLQVFRLRLKVSSRASA